MRQALTVYRVFDQRDVTMQGAAEMRDTLKSASDVLSN